MVAAGAAARHPGGAAGGRVRRHRHRDRVCAATLSDASARPAVDRGRPALGGDLRVRAAAAAGFGPPRAMPGPPVRGATGDHPRRIIIREDDGPGPEFLNAPGQAARTVGAVIAQGTSGRRRRHHRRRCSGRDQLRGATAQLAQIAPNRRSDDRRTRRARPLPGGAQPLPRPGGDDRGRPAHLRCRRHAAVGAGDVLRGRRRRAGRRHDGGHSDHPPPTRAAVNGFRGCAAGGRPRARPRRGAAADAHRQGRPGRRAHRDRPAGLRAEPDARPHRRRVVRPACQRDAGAAVRRRRQPRTAHPAGGDPRVYRTGATQTDDAARRRRARDEPGGVRDRADDPARRGHAAARAPRHRATAGARAGGPDPAGRRRRQRRSHRGTRPPVVVGPARRAVVVSGDEARLHQVLANLLANARTHTPAGHVGHHLVGRR